VDAKVKAEALARSLGRDISNAITVTEDVLVSSSGYTALRFDHAGRIRIRSRFQP
jgi:hypothetical protein